MQLLHLNDTERQRSADLQWAMQASEMRQHAGKFVAVHRKRVVCVGGDRETLLAEAAEKEQCSREELVVVVVPSADLSETPR